MPSVVALRAFIARSEANARWQLAALCCWRCWRAADEPGPPLKNSEPLSPSAELKSFRVPKGFRVELVASEPDVVDPVAMAFDEKGRIFVAEMRGYPNAGVGTGDITSGRIKLLEDRDGDGFYRDQHHLRRRPALSHGRHAVAQAACSWPTLRT